MPSAKSTSAAKKLSAKKVEKKAPATASITIDYPEQGERVLQGHYAIRISATAAEEIEVSVNDGEWQNCRQANGYFWFDWFPEKAGSQSIAARSKGAAKNRKSASRGCVVITPNSN